MELENSFVVPTDIDTAWKTLLDVETIAPCMPGATLTAFDGTTASATVKVKLGPVLMNFAGDATFESTDSSTYTAVINANGRETKGAGTAGARVTATLSSEGPQATRATIITDLTVTGKAAQFGRGVMADVSRKLIDQFAANLEQVIRANAAVVSDASAAADLQGEPAVTPMHNAAPLPQLNNDALDLGNAALIPVLKRVVPAVAIAVVVIGLVWWLAKRK